MRKRVLVLDDEPCLARSVARILCHEFDVDIFVRGTEALKAVEARPYHCVISDVLMGGMSGTEFHTKALDIRPELSRHFMFYSGTPQFAKSEVPTLTKPASAEEILTTVRRLAS